MKSGSNRIVTLPGKPVARIQIDMDAKGQAQVSGVNLAPRPGLASGPVPLSREDVGLALLRVGVQLIEESFRRPKPAGGLDGNEKT